jgi:Pilus formation protein N terminal region
MSIRFMRLGARAFLLVASFAVGILLGPAAAVAGTADDAVAVNVDQAKLVKLPERVSTIVVGNPLIADVTMQPGGMVVVTGKGYGATNFIAMNRAGEVLVDRVIQVQGPTDRVITVYRGVDRESYSCSPICQRRVTLGDGEAYFKSTMDQAGALNSQATGATAKP